MLPIAFALFCSLVATHARHHQHPMLTVALVDQCHVVRLGKRAVVVVASRVGRVERRLNGHELRVGLRRLDGFGELGLEGLEVCC